MVTELVLTAFLDLAAWLLGLLPEDSVVWPDGDAWAAWIGEHAGPWDALFPLSEFAAILAETLTVVAPVMLAVRLSMFIWFLLPVIK